MSSYDHFCLLQHIRSSAFPYVNSSAALPSAAGSLHDALAEMCYFYAQNLPTIVTLGHSSRVQAWPSRRFSRSSVLRISLVGYYSWTLIRVSRAAMESSFDKNVGALSAHAKGVLIANAAWRTLVLLLSWCVAFLCFM
jgi:hypothetical protein